MLLLCLRRGGVECSLLLLLLLLHARCPDIRGGCSRPRLVLLMLILSLPSPGWSVRLRLLLSLHLLLLVLLVRRVVHRGHLQILRAVARCGLGVGQADLNSCSGGGGTRGERGGGTMGRMLLLWWLSSLLLLYDRRRRRAHPHVRYGLRRLLRLLLLRQR